MMGPWPKLMEGVCSKGMMMIAGNDESKQAVRLNVWVRFRFMQGWNGVYVKQMGRFMPVRKHWTHISIV